MQKYVNSIYFFYAFFSFCFGNRLYLNFSAFPSLESLSFVSPQKLISNVIENHLELNKSIHIKDDEKIFTNTLTQYITNENHSLDHFDK